MKKSHDDYTNNRDHDRAMTRMRAEIREIKESLGLPDDWIPLPDAGPELEPHQHRFPRGV